jgi:hypothetical protein
MAFSFPATQVRGIYATAITSLLLDLDVPIANPSPVIRDRVSLNSEVSAPAVLIRDRRDCQGITLSGQEEPDVTAILNTIRAALPHAVARPGVSSEAGWSVELPAEVKQLLDDRRRAILPTVYLHHQLKTISSDKVDLVEKQVAKAPERMTELSNDLRNDLIDRRIVHGARMSVHHVKPAGQAYDLRGTVGSFDGRFLSLDRRFYPGGLYDSLDVPRLQGDYGRLEIEAGSGISVRRYFRADGTHLGDLYNLATGAEIYPHHVRYVDLELDVLHMPGEPPRVVDEADLERAHERGYLSQALVDEAWALPARVISSIEAHERAEHGNGCGNGTECPCAQPFIARC